MNAYDVQHLMRGGKISQSSVADIVYEWQTSKIVKFGSFILYLFWTGVVAGVYHIPGFIAWIILTIAIFIDYRWYKKTKSEVAWKFLQSLIGILVLVLISFSISGHYYSP
jgi:DMSO/TMAO reductase YedYZ heme-binding membrane subunit